MRYVTEIPDPPDCCDNYPECQHRADFDRAKVRRKTDTCVHGVDKRLYCERCDHKSAFNQRLTRAPVRRKTDPQYREALADRLKEIASAGKFALGPDAATLVLAANKLRRDELTNAEMIDVLTKAGYQDIPAQVDAALIRRLLGYITPR